MLKIFSIVVFFLGVALLIITIIYGKKIDWRKTREEYQNIQDGDLRPDKSVIHSKKISAEKLYEEAPVKEEREKPRELTLQEKEIFSKVERKIEREATQNMKTAFLDAETDVLNENNMNKEWDKKTQFLDDITEVLVEAERRKEK